MAQRDLNTIDLVVTELIKGSVTTGNNWLIPVNQSTHK
jgi:hypothetical protein